MDQFEWVHIDGLGEAYFVNLQQQLIGTVHILSTIGTGKRDTNVASLRPPFLALVSGERMAMVTTISFGL